MGVTPFLFPTCGDTVPFEEAQGSLVTLGGAHCYLKPISVLGQSLLTGHSCVVFSFHLIKL
jgi:hypothetical protein